MIMFASFYSHKLKYKDIDMFYLDFILLCLTGGTVTAADLPGTGYGKSHTQVNIESRPTKWK